MFEYRAVRLLQVRGTTLIEEIKTKNLIGAVGVTKIVRGTTLIEEIKTKVGGGEIYLSFNVRGTTLIEEIKTFGCGGDYHHTTGAGNYSD